MIKCQTATTFLFAFALAGSCLAQPVNAPAATTNAPASAVSALTIAFTGIKDPTGVIMISLFDSQAGYDADKPVRVGAKPVTGTDTETLFEGLPAGRYAVKAFHDGNSDGRLTVNAFGMPSEPFAFSNDALGKMGPASWEQAAFDVGSGAARHVITIR